MGERRLKTKKALVGELLDGDNDGSDPETKIWWRPNCSLSGKAM